MYSHDILFLLDSGASISIINKQTYNALCHALPFLLNSGNKIYLANQSEMKIIRCATLRVQIGLLDVMHNLLIADTLTQQVILGLDFLEPHKCILDFKQGFCLIQGQKILFQPEGYAPQWVRALHDTSVPPQSENIIYGKVPLPTIHSAFLSDASSSYCDMDVVSDEDTSQSDSNTTKFNQPAQPGLPVILPTVQQAPLCRGTQTRLPPN